MPNHQTLTTSNLQIDTYLQRFQNVNLKTNKVSTVLIITLMTLNPPPHSLIVNCQQKLNMDLNLSN